MSRPTAACSATAASGASRSPTPPQPKPGGIAEVFLIGRDFIGADRVGLILGDNLFYGDSLPTMAERGATGTGAVIYAYWVADPSAYGVVEFDADGTADQHRREAEGAAPRTGP